MLNDECVDTPLVGADGGDAEVPHAPDADSLPPFLRPAPTPPESELARRPQAMTRRQELLRCALRGLSAKRASEELGIPYSAARQAYLDRGFRSICYGRLEEAFEGADAQFTDDKLTLAERMQQKCNSAFETLCDLMDNNEVHPGVRAKIAMDMLDRNPDTQAGHTIRHAKFEPAQLRNAAAAAAEMDNVIAMKRSA